MVASLRILMVSRCVSASLLMSYSVMLDLKILAEDLKFVRSMATVEPLKSRIVREVDPGLEISSIEGVKSEDKKISLVETISNRHGILDYLKDTCVPSYHATGSLSMLPRENNGVVNPKLKVSQCTKEDIHQGLTSYRSTELAICVSRIYRLFLSVWQRIHSQLLTISESTVCPA